MKTNMIKLNNSVVMCLIVVLISCEDFVNIGPPPKELSPVLVFEDESTATSAVLSLYAYAWDFGYNIAFRTGLSSDELANLSTDVNQQQLFENELLADNFYVDVSWTDFYQVILHANTILEGLEVTSGLTNEVQAQLEGEARFMRAFTYFHLVNLFGEVPTLTTSDYRINASAGRGTVEDVYALIVEDLVMAQALIADGYITGERVRANKAAVTALLARVYLYQGNWSKAEAEATKVINNSLYSLNTNLNTLLTINNQEAILQFYSAQDFVNTYEGLYFTPYIPGQFHPFSNTVLSENIINSFEPGDQRLTHWVGSYVFGNKTYHYSYKAKVFSGATKTEYPTVLRLSEQYLIRAEARTRQGNFPGTQEDLNVVRNRAGLENTTAADEESLLSAIEQERKVELFAEGHRWYDLKRTNIIDGVMSSKAGWQSTDVLYPIPEYELLNNPNMTQNDGY